MRLRAVALALSIPLLIVAPTVADEDALDEALALVGMRRADLGWTQGLVAALSGRAVQAARVRRAVLRAA